MLTGAGGIGRSLAVIRGGERRRQMIDPNRTDPGALDRQIATGKAELDKAVSGHSSL